MTGFRPYTEHKANLTEKRYCIVRDWDGTQEVVAHMVTHEECEQILDEFHATRQDLINRGVDIDHEELYVYAESADVWMTIIHGVD